VAKPIKRMLSLFVVCFLALQKIAFSADQATLEQAKKEGQLVFYSGIFETEARALIARFEQKFPFIKTTLYRAGGVSLVSRIQNEHRAGSQLWDVFNSAGLEGFVLLEQGYFVKYISPEAKYFHEGFRDPDGFWTTMYASPYVATYNTRMVPAKDVPKDYFQLLDERWSANWRSIQRI
jgi:iron(III) transport system substrate-binding protein